MVEAEIKGSSGASLSAHVSDETATEPKYVRQTGEPKNPTEVRAWFESCAREAEAEGCTFARSSYHPTIPHLYLFEAWLEQPSDQGALRWALVDGASSASTMANSGRTQ